MHMYDIDYVLNTHVCATCVVCMKRIDFVAKLNKISFRNTKESQIMLQKFLSFFYGQSKRLKISRQIRLVPLFYILSYVNVCAINVGL